MNNMDMEETIEILRNAVVNNTNSLKKEKTDYMPLSKEELIQFQKEEQLKDLRQVRYNKCSH